MVATDSKNLSKHNKEKKVLTLGDLEWPWIEIQVTKTPYELYITTLQRSNEIPESSFQLAPKQRFAISYILQSPTLHIRSIK